jgi:hypothetical protein
MQINGDTDSKCDEYDLMVEQQRMLEEYQSLLKNKHVIPPTQNDANRYVISFVNMHNYYLSSAKQSPILTVPITQLVDLTVGELKNECKKRSLPVSGSKTGLLSRLKQFEVEIVTERRQNQRYATSFV